MAEASTQEGNENDGGSDDDDDDEFGLYATVQFVQGFDTVKMDQVSGCMDQCSICLEDFSSRSEATRMPCSHLYHIDCIFQWLGKDNSCPLCRYQISI
ncbi:hypothetical protein ACSBR2_038652 [Camellia fascicularis]